MTATARERGDLAERLLPVAARLACVAHGDGDWHDIAHVLAPLNHGELQALAVVLAALVDPEQDLADALAYVTWDETGRPAPRSLPHGTIRQAAHVQWTPTVRPAVTGGYPRDRALVEDTAELISQGLNRDDIAARLGTTWARISTAHSRCRVPLPTPRNEVAA